MKWIKKIIALGIVLLGIGLFFTFILEKANNKNYFKDLIINNKVKSHHDIEAIDTIVIKADVGKINLKPSSEKKLTYNYQGIFSNVYQTEIDNRTLILKSSKINLVKIVGLENVNLDILIPNKSDLDIIIENSGAHIYTNKIKLKSLKVVSDVGLIKVVDTKIDNSLEIVNHVGAIKVENVKEPKKIKIKNSTGAIELKDLYGKNLHLKNDGGSITYINSNKDYSFNTLEIDVSSGKQLIKVR